MTDLLELHIVPCIIFEQIRQPEAVLFGAKDLHKGQRVRRRQFYLIRQRRYQGDCGKRNI